MKPQLPFAISLDPGSSLANRTGSWRTKRPEYVDRLPPCNHACPAGENIQGWLFYAEEGRYEEAWRVLTQDNPFPAIHGRVCYHPCESACNRGRLDQTVNIHAIERFLGDLAIQKGWQIPPGPSTGKRVLVVGAGPSGLSCAYHLARLGHAVTIQDAGPKPGGMMRFGIPSYRLPRDILDGEIARLTHMGVQIVLSSKVEDLMATMQKGHFDAAFLAVGAHLSKRVDIPCRDAGRVLDAVSFLRQIETAGPAEKPRIGRRVAVYGGGNTAMDAARTAKRLGADEALIIYRRDRAHMPAHDSEVQEAQEEGVLVHWLRTVKEVGEGEMQVEVMELDDKGQARPTGKFEKIEADTLILALGQESDVAFLANVPGLKFAKDGTLEVDTNMMAGYPGLFAGGDMVPGQRTVTVAVGHGKRAARCINAYLKGQTYERPSKRPIATFDKLNTWYYTDAPKTVQPKLDMIRRLSSFEEIHQSLDESNALYEARRCLSCGNCFECDNCYGVCPDNAVIKLGEGKRFQFNHDYCKGCGLCAQECPCGAIEMVNEDI